MLVAGLWIPVYGSQVGEGWLYGAGVFLPDKLGWSGTLIFTLVFLTIVYAFVTCNKNKPESILCMVFLRIKSYIAHSILKGGSS